MPTNRSRAIAVAALLASACDIPRGDERLCVEPLYAGDAEVPLGASNDYGASAEIVVDGERRATITKRTGARLAGLAPGRHRVTVRRAGRDVQTFDVHIPRGQPMRIRQSMYGLTFIVSEARTCAWDESG